MTELDLREGWVEPELAEEFPELGLTYTRVEARPRPSPEPIRERLATLSNRYTGARVIHMRQDPVPWAYRVFYRQVGIDPDTDRTPVERVALERLRAGALLSQNIVDDALVIAIAETGVPVVAFDTDRVGDAIGLRLSAEREPLGGSGRPLPGRQIVVADEDRPLSVLFGEVAEERGVVPETERMTIAALRVKGVPLISAEEALWTVAETLWTRA